MVCGSAKPSLATTAMAGDVDTAVEVHEDVTLLLACETEQPDSPFCCNKPYSNDSQACGASSRGSFQPFQLPIGRIVYNRSDGSVMTNGSLPSSLFQQNACETQTVGIQNQTTHTPGPTTCPEVAVQAQPPNVAAIAAGIAAPRGVLSLASLAAVAVLWRQNRSLKRSAQHQSLEQKPPFAQAASGGDVEISPVRDEGWQGAYLHSPAKEMPNESAVIESGGRAVLQELLARNLGD